ncbi:hypothetical protein GCM10023116_41270 [Kistimonas scapharcae]|uniref:Uncharacterized protein n=1 Tax=Kistimonas scapharcae TaxID=1036133 RepID=A0ABP8V6G6_9GAMM
MVSTMSHWGLLLSLGAGSEVAKEKEHHRVVRNSRARQGFMRADSVTGNGIKAGVLAIMRMG